MKRIYSFSLLCFFIFLGNLFLLKTITELPEFFTSYLNDLMCLPVVLGICLFLIRTFSQHKEIRLSLFSVLSLAAFYAVFFEVYLPSTTMRYTADTADVIMYFTGAILFWLLQPQRLKKAQENKKAAWNRQL